MNDTQKKLELLIDALPKDLDGLVEYLRAENCKGRRGDADSCPLANHFKARGVKANVGGSVITTNSVNVSLPNHLKQFVHNFDAVMYPDLQL